LGHLYNRNFVEQSSSVEECDACLRQAGNGSIMEVSLMGLINLLTKIKTKSPFRD
jgi:hypothetical protein